MATEQGEWLNDNPARRSKGDGILTMKASSGSLWLTRHERVQKGWDDVGVPENIFALQQRQPMAFSAEVRCTPSSSGNQAGLYALASDTAWVKLVVEGGDAGQIKLVFAHQDLEKGTAPFVTGRVPLESHFADGRVRLKLEVHPDQPQCIAGYWASGAEDAAWVPVTRGLGWLTTDELADEPFDYGCLEVGDPRGLEPAVCSLPHGWRAVVLSEQWEAESDHSIEFRNIQTHEHSGS